MQSGLYCVATPIGNLADFSERGKTVLAKSDVIYAEDTRNSLALLTHFGINTPLKSLHQHNEHVRIEAICSVVEAGQIVALISDAGTPLISDPGYQVVHAMRERGLPVHTVPGPCAAIAALSVAGLPTDQFWFEGFLPPKKQARQARVTELLQLGASVVCYESKHRILDCLLDIAELVPEHGVFLAREITKRYETHYFGNASEVLHQLEQDEQQQKGEFVLILAPGKKTKEDGGFSLTKVLKVLLVDLSVKQAAALAADICDLPKNDCYKQALALKKNQSS